MESRLTLLSYNSSLKSLNIKNEFFLKILKLYGWELSFQKMIYKIRSFELKILKNYSIVYGVLVLFWNTATYLVCFYYLLIF